MRDRSRIVAWFASGAAVTSVLVVAGSYRYRVAQDQTALMAATSDVRFDETLVAYRLALGHRSLALDRRDEGRGGDVMSESRETTPSDEDADLTREIRAGRTFSLSEAIGRMAGGGLMKGASPVSRTRQAELVIEDYLRRHLTDAGGALGGVLLRRVGMTDPRLGDHDDPLLALAEHVRRVLGSEHLLQDLVREADVEWGRVFHERPRFERAECPPHPDDPYTIESVRISLFELVEKLSRRQ